MGHCRWGDQAKLAQDQLEERVVNEVAANYMGGRLVKGPGRTSVRAEVPAYC